MFEFFVKKRDSDIEPTAECLAIPEIKKIWDRDKMKSKKQAKNDLAIIYFAGYYNSPYKGYGEDQKWNHIGKSFKNDEGWRPWKDDKDINNALEEYKELQLSSSHSMSLLITLRETLLVSKQTIKSVQDEIKKQDEEQDDSAKKLKKDLDYIEKLIGLGEKLPNTLKKIQEMEEKVNEELSNAKARGGGSVLESEKPPENE